MAVQFGQTQQVATPQRATGGVTFGQPSGFPQVTITPEGQPKQLIAPPKPGLFSRGVQFGKEVVRGIGKPIIKSFLAPGQLIETVRTGEIPRDLSLPFFGDVTPVDPTQKASTNIRRGLGTALQTGLLALGGFTIKQLLKSPVKTILAEGLIGSGFGLGIGLEEDQKGKELATTIGIGGALGTVIPLGFLGARATLKGFKKGVTRPATRIDEITGKVIPKVADEIPVAPKVSNAKVIGKLKQLGKEVVDSPVGNVITSVDTRLQRLGEEGGAILKGIQKIDREGLLRTGTAIDNLTESGLFKLNREQAFVLQDSLIGKVDPNTLSPDLQKVFDVVDGLRKEIAQEAREQGVKVRVKPGVERDFFARKDFFPQIIPDIKVLKKGAIREDIIENVVRTGRFDTPEQAGETLDSFIRFVETEGRGGDALIDFLVRDGQAKTRTEARGLISRAFRPARLRRSGSLEFSRIVDNPFFDPDPRRVIPQYISNSFHRLETIKTFGQKSEILNQLVGKLQRALGREKGQEARVMLNRIMEVIESAPKEKRLSLALRTIQIPKLAFAQILNVGQPIINGMLKADFPSLAHGLVASLNATGRRAALKSGSTLDRTIKETLRRAGSSEGVGAKILKFTGFTATEKWNRTVSANTGMKYLQRQFELLKKKPQSQAIRSRIAELGLDPDKLLKQGTLKEKDLLTAGQLFTNLTQFRARPIDLPDWVQSPMGKVLFQFKSFGFQQGKLLKNEFKRAVKNNDWNKFTRLFLVLGFVFPMTGEILADVRSLVTQSKRPTKALDRYFDSMASAGAFGLTFDFWRSAQFGKLAESVLGPTVGTTFEAVERGIRDAPKLINEGKVTDSTLKFLLNQLGITRPLANILFPPRDR